MTLDRCWCGVVDVMKTSNKLTPSTPLYVSCLDLGSISSKYVVNMIVWLVALVLVLLQGKKPVPPCSLFPRYMSPRITLLGQGLGLSGLHSKKVVVL